MARPARQVVIEVAPSQVRPEEVIGRLARATEIMLQIAARVDADPSPRPPPPQPAPT
jgi:hypothetical protein